MASATVMSTAALRRSGSLLLRVVLVILVCVILLPYLIVPLYIVVRPVSTLMLWRWAKGAHVERVWVPIDAMAPALPLTVIVAEDARFCSHHGVDLHEIRAAIVDAEDHGELRGGSTITQQTAKNLFLWPGRSYLRKVLEIPLALWIDLVLGKRRTLEIYLNIAEWGPSGEFGAEAGARHAFGKSARDIGASEAGLMAAMLPNPVRRNAKRPSAGLLRLRHIYEARARNSAALGACVRVR
jgi:monofunctional glycosyltransferase